MPNADLQRGRGMRWEGGGLRSSARGMASVQKTGRELPCGVTSLTSPRTRLAFGAVDGSGQSSRIRAQRVSQLARKGRSPAGNRQGGCRARSLSMRGVAASAGAQHPIKSRVDNGACPRPGLQGRMKYCMRPVGGSGDGGGLCRMRMVLLGADRFSGVPSCLRMWRGGHRAGYGSTAK
jgi:hypothetical protein